ncbi:acetyl-CoA carboxylase biotin carboxyl carrier protein subunit [Streptomyces bathyalis]|uniref:Biotin carboxyl carrier protein of acetyl-CoA carboxylase n=2 Tax=Streptomyces bathyalis TaxID=2710756 RepID=A0A7T1WU48_9ACTN|nr:acetyl-CoA carboxylase biotin carboxyl carrier protein subunit [Streptomyces bathyalis]
MDTATGTATGTATDTERAAQAKQDELLRSVCARVAQLAESSQTGPRVIRMSVSGISVEVEWPEPGQLDTVVAPVAIPDGSGPDPTEESDLHHVCAPTVGRFYHCPNPGARPFVTVGDRVEEGQQVGILEAMKLMMPIHAEVTGIVEEILVPDTASVEFGEPLLAVSPAGGEE